jgi:uncharacterized membrane protein
MNKKTIRWLLKELPTLRAQGVIDDDSSQRMQDYYEASLSTVKGSLLFTLFGVFGSLLIGAGIISLFAHNWDELSRPAKLSLAFTPLIIGQGLFAYALLKRASSRAWREGSSLFLSISVATVIALVGQTYHVDGNFADFTLAWMLLTIPIIICGRSTATTLLFAINIFSWACAMASDYRTPYLYTPLILTLLCFFLFELYKSGTAIATRFIGWICAITIPLSLLPVTIFYKEVNTFIIYASLFSLFYCLSNLRMAQRNEKNLNSFSWIGICGTIGMSLACTCSDMWRSMMILSFTEVTAWFPLLLAGITYLFCFKRTLTHTYLLGAFPFIFSLSHALAVISKGSGVAVALFNTYLLVVGVYTIVTGVRSALLERVNLGIALIAGLIIIRFFDSHISFIARGIIFILIGIGFISANIIMHKRKKDLGSTEIAREAP